jgi:putative lysine transport system substrate-binding protein
MFKFRAVVPVVLLGSLTLLSACGSDADKPADGEGPLKIGMEAAYAPFNWTQQDDSNGAVPIVGGGYAGGYDVQIAKKIGESMGRDVEVVKTAWDGLIPSLNADKIDMIVAGMSPTAERREAIDFSEPYYASDPVIVVQKDGKYANAKSLADFSGARITAQLGTLHLDLIDQIPGVSKEPGMKDFPTMIAGLQADKIDGYISELPGALSAVKANPDLAYVKFDANGFDVENDEITLAVGLKKGSPLMADVNKAIEGISESERASLMDAAVEQQPGD